MTIPSKVVSRLTISAMLASGLMLAPRTGTHAQLAPPTNLDCDYQRLIPPAPGSLDPAWRPYYPSVQIAALRPVVDSGGWSAAMDSIRTSFERAAVSFGSATADAATLERFRHQLDSAHARLARLASSTSRDQLTEERRRLGPMVFNAEVRDGRAVLFRGTGDEIELTDSSAQGTRRAVCYHAAVMRSVLDRYTQPGRAAAAAVIEAKRVRWEHYFERGYSQLPWELFLNSRLARKAADLDPPTRQLILLHPSVGLEVPTRSIRDLTRQDAVALELLGWIRYRNDYRDYLGLSGVVTFTEGLGTGVGPFLHFGRVAKVGYVFRARRTDASGARKQDGVLISVDLYKYLADRKAQVETALAGVRSTIGGS